MKTLSILPGTNTKDPKSDSAQNAKDMENTCLCYIRAQRKMTTFKMIFTIAVIEEGRRSFKNLPVDSRTTDQVVTCHQANDHNGHAISTTIYCSHLLSLFVSVHEVPYFKGSAAYDVETRHLRRAIFYRLPGGNLPFFARARKSHDMSHGAHMACLRAVLGLYNIRITCIRTTSYFLNENTQTEDLSVSVQKHRRKPNVPEDWLQVFVSNIVSCRVY